MTSSTTRADVRSLAAGQTSHTIPDKVFDMWEDHMELGRTMDVLRGEVVVAGGRSSASPPGSVSSWPGQRLDSQALLYHQQHLLWTDENFNSSVDDSSSTPLSPGGSSSLSWSTSWTGSDDVCSSAGTGLSPASSVSGYQVGDWLVVGPRRPAASATIINNNSSSSTINYCGFCKKNGETSEVYRSHHALSLDRRVTTCPVLRAYTCPLCQATGDRAHTRRHCPRAQQQRDSGGIH